MFGHGSSNFTCMIEQGINHRFHLTISGTHGNFLSKLELTKINQTNANKISSQHYLLSLTIDVFPSQPENMSSNEISFYKQIFTVYSMPLKIHFLSRVLVTHFSFTTYFHPVIQTSTNFVDFVSN